MKFFILPTVIVFGWVIHHNTHKKKGTNEKDINSFLRREDAANSTRRQDISHLDYIVVPLDTFPFDITLKDEKKQSQIEKYKEEILRISKNKMLNLMGISNTRLKELYGPANLETLSCYDQNYTQYIRNLHLYASTILEEYPVEGIQILEYCISIGTDISGTYECLGKYYAQNQDKEKFEMLYQAIPDPETIAGKVIKSKLDALSGF